MRNRVGKMNEFTTDDEETLYGHMQDMTNQDVSDQEFSMSRTISIQSHGRDCNFIVFPNGKEHQGYVPDDIGIGGGDDVMLEIDIDTGKIVGWSDDIRDAILNLQSHEKLNCSGDHA